MSKLLAFTLLFSSAAFANPSVCHVGTDYSQGYAVVIQDDFRGATLLNDGRLLVPGMQCTPLNSRPTVICRKPVVNSDGYQVEVYLSNDGHPQSVQLFSDGFAGPQPIGSKLPCTPSVP